MAKKRESRGDRMYNPAQIEEYFKKYIHNLGQFLPDGVIEVDIDLLHRFDLLNYEKKQDPSLTRYFHVIEAMDKITLINDQFIIWIVPETTERSSKTYVLIALNKKGIPELELAFVTSDVYNSSKLVLRILEKFLHEIQENEDLLIKNEGDKIIKSASLYAQEDVKPTLTFRLKKFFTGGNNLFLYVLIGVLLLIGYFIFRSFRRW